MGSPPGQCVLGAGGKGGPWPLGAGGGDVSRGRKTNCLPVPGLIEFRIFGQTECLESHVLPNRWFQDAVF